MSRDRQRQLALEFPAPQRCTLANFEVGPNAELVAALQACSEYDRFSAVWLTGEAGSGKSHLLHGACHAAVARGHTAAYLPSQLRSAGPSVFDGLGRFAVVAIDDVADWVGAAEWEEALLGLYQRLFDRRATLLVASSAAPGEVSIALPDLASRLRAAQVYRIGPLRDVDRANALTRWAAERGLELGIDVVPFILRRVPRGMDALASVFERLDRGALMQQRRLTIPLVKELLGL